MTARGIVVFVLLVAAAFGSWYLARSGINDRNAPLPVDTAHRGYYLKAARILGTGEDGSLLYEITAEHAEQLVDESIQFTDVRISYSPGAEIPWTVDADKAILLKDEPRVKLSGHVLAVSPEGVNGGDTEIRTNYLELDPENYVAETDERVQIRLGARSLTATGMLASLNENTMELKSNVSGKFAP